MSLLRHKYCRTGRILLLQALVLYATAGATMRSLAAERTITKPRWDQLTSDKAFGYRNEHENIVTPKPYKASALQKFFKAFFQFFESPAGRTLVWLFVISLACFILYKLFIDNKSFLFGKRKQEGESPGDEQPEDLESTNWETLLQHATAKQDLRLAVRYSYMWLLQLLQQRELIRYRIDKTNHDYYMELLETQYKQAFRQLSRQYEYTWYGQFVLSPAAYNEYISLFMNVKKQLAS